MGLLRKIFVASNGMGPVEVTTQRLLREIATRAMQGHDDFVVVVKGTDVGVRNTLSLTMPRIIDRIQDAGHSVLNVTSDTNNTLVNLRVRPAGSSSPPQVQPTPPQAQPAYTPPTGLSEKTDSEAAAFRAIRHFGTRDKIGAPFGPACGLEEAMTLVRRVFSYVDSDRLALASEGAASIVADDIARRRVTFDDWDNILGHHLETYKRHGLGKMDLRVAIHSLSEVKKLLGDIQVHSGPQYAKWVKDEDFKIQAFVYCWVTNCRLGESGKLPLLEL
jgi:hypothetical protein